MGALNDLVESAELGALGRCSIVCELVSLIADYQEEGASLYLDAFVIKDLSELTNLIPQSTYLRIGTARFDEDGVKGGALKKAAPLVGGCWRMYLSGSGGDLEFGLFRDSGHPLNVPIDLMLDQGGVGDAKFIRITKLAQDAVRVSTHDGKKVVVNFTNAKDALADDVALVGKLADSICAGLEEKVAQTCETYLTSLLSKAIRDPTDV